jgi:hypothetical protein
MVRPLVISIRKPYYLVFTLLINICSLAYSQGDSISKANISKTTINFSDKPGDNELIPLSGSMTDKNTAFLNSLRQKAAKNTFTRKLYDIVVVYPEIGSNVNQRGESESSYISFSGKKIRKIDITRLSVFGSNIDNPSYYKNNRSQNFLNKTHVNTLDIVIRNNLLFKTGDTISPIILSDNERLLRELSFIDDARIKVVPVSGNEVDVQVITKDVYSLGGTYNPSGLTSGRVTLFENNIFGLGHDFGFEIPFDSNKPDSPGFGVHYLVDNLARSFINLRVFYHHGLGEEAYGVGLNRKFVSSETKYAGGLSIEHMYRFEDLDTMSIPQPLKYNLQNYWFARSFLLDRSTVTRFIISARYTNNNVLNRPFILPDSYHTLQKYRMYLASLAFSRQRFYKTNLVYGYGRTEDIPYGLLAKAVLGKEVNEFKTRNYAGAEISFGKSFRGFGYLQSSAGLGSFINQNRTEQGIVYFDASYFSNLLPVGRSLIRNFVRLDFTRGFDRNLDEYLKYYNDNGFSGFRNDSIQGRQRITLGLETIIFSPINIYGFRFAFFGFADASSLSGTNQILAKGTGLSGIGIGMRVRNDNLIFNTFQIRIGFFPDPPQYSRINNVTVSGHQPLRMENFDTGEPSPIPYR